MEDFLTTLTLISRLKRGEEGNRKLIINSDKRIGIRSCSILGPKASKLFVEHVP